VGLCCRLDKEKALAFIMAGHARLGSASFASMLADDLAQRIVHTAATWPQGTHAKNLSKSCLRLMGGAFVERLEGSLGQFLFSLGRWGWGRGGIFDFDGAKTEDDGNTSIASSSQEVCVSAQPSPSQVPRVHDTV